MSPISKHSRGDGRNELTFDELTHLLPDYINGHLDAKTQAKMASALASDADLRAQHEFQIDLQFALRSEAEVADTQAQLNSIQGVSGFAAITDRLEESAVQRLLNRLSNVFRLGGGVSLPTALAPALAVIVAVGLFAGVNQGDPDMTINDFETRISVETFDQPTLRILAKPELETVALAVLLREHGLQLEQHLPDGNMVEVSPVTKDQELADLVEALQADDRVVFAKIVSTGARDESGSR